MKINKMLLKGYYDRKCTDEEARVVQRWLSDPANKEEVAGLLSELWDAAEEEEPEVEVDFQGIFTHIIRNSNPRRALRGNNGLMDSAGHRRAEKPGLLIAHKIAAGLVSILVISVLAYKIFLEDRYFIYSTAYGETRKVTLPDGSEVTLNANSTIRYSYNFNESSEGNTTPREVYLEGEGFFDVKRNIASTGSAVKFIVHANDVDVEVLGTSFNVSTRRGKTMVALNSGKVRLGIEDSGNRTKEMIMSPGELVEIGNSEKAFVKRTVDVEPYSAWRHNRLVFGNTRVKDVLNLIEDNFGYEIVLSDKTLEKRLYTDTTPADNLDLLLSKLSIVYDLDITRTGGQVIIRSKN